jgi:hypothetical protein
MHAGSLGTSQRGVTGGACTQGLKGRHRGACIACRAGSLGASQGGRVSSRQGSLGRHKRQGIRTQSN